MVIDNVAINNDFVTSRKLVARDKSYVFEIFAFVNGDVAAALGIIGNIVCGVAFICINATTTWIRTNNTSYVHTLFGRYGESLGHGVRIFGRALCGVFYVELGFRHSALFRAFSGLGVYVVNTYIRERDCVGVVLPCFAIKAVLDVGAFGSAIDGDSLGFGEGASCWGEGWLSDGCWGSAYELAT